MDVREMEVVPVAHREPPLRNSFGIHSPVEARTIVRLTTADGAVGVSETYGNDATISALDSARDLVEGRAVYDRRELELALEKGRGRGDENAYAFGAVETAMLDLIGKESGRPVCDLLGGRIRDEVEFSAYLFFKEAEDDHDGAAIAPEDVLTPEAMVDEARAFVDAHGFETLKLKAGVLEPDEEVRTLELLAEEFGRDTPLRIDPNGVWSVETATRLARELEAADLHLQFLEDPVPTMDGHRRLKRHTSLPVATNMYVTSFDDIPPAVGADAVDVVLSDHHYWGGLENTLALDRICRTFDLGVGMHSNSHLGVSMAAMTHVAAAMPTLRYAADTHYPWETEDVVVDPLSFEAGAIAVPDAPGLGVEINEDRLDRLNERYREYEPERDDTARMLSREDDWLPNKPKW